jgi:hypothetical protein
MPTEKVRLRIGNLAKAVLVSGQAYQDPKDALNEFVSNAADEYAEAGWQGRRIRIVLRRRGRHPLLAIADDGRGMDLEKLRQIARNLFESSKAGDPRTIGEKAIGILAFQQLGGRCDIVTRPLGEPRTHALRLVRGDAVATLDPDERRRARDPAGTTVYIADLDPDVLRMLTLRKVVDYLRRRRAAALARDDYAIEVIEGGSAEVVTPERPDGLRLDIPPVSTLWGRIEFALYVAPRADRLRRVAIVGRGGTTIIEDMCDLEELDTPPWNTDQVAGQIVFDGLSQTAGRRAIVRDRDAFPVFIDSVRRVEPAVLRAVERIAAQVEDAVSERVSDTIRRIFERVLKELADLENPMRTPIGDEAGAGGLFEPAAAEPNRGSGDDARAGREFTSRIDALDGDAPQRLDELDQAPIAEAEPPRAAAQPDRRRVTELPTLAPDPTPSQGRSRFDAENGVVLYNEGHPDYLTAKQDETLLLDYLATLVAKEYVVYNNPRASSDDVAEEMVRLLVRLRRHLPARRPERQAGSQRRKA